MQEAAGDVIETSPKHRRGPCTTPTFLRRLRRANFSQRATRRGAICERRDDRAGLARIDALCCEEPCERGADAAKVGDALVDLEELRVSDSGHLPSRHGAAL